MNRVKPLWVGLLTYAAVAACNQAPSRLNAPPQGSTEYPHELQDSYVHMLDNAMLADMAIADVHFVPHTSELNSLGGRRLERYAKLLKVYGGKLWYDTALQDRELVNARIDHVKDFLVLAGVERGRIDVVVGMPGGQGISAEEAIQIRAESLQRKKENGGDVFSSLGKMIGEK